MKITMSLPVIAFATFSAEIDTEGKTKEEIFDELLSEGQCEASICWHCSKNTETDYEILDDVFIDKELRSGYIDEMDIQEG